MDLGESCAAWENQMRTICLGNLGDEILSCHFRAFIGIMFTSQRQLARQPAVGYWQVYDDEPYPHLLASQNF